MVIFDELTYAENLKKKGFAKRANTKDLKIYAKWLKHNNFTSKQIKDELLKLCHKYDLTFNEIIHAKYIKDAIREIKKNRLRIPISIGITQSEIDKIESLPTIKHRKIMFIVLLTSKYLKLNNVKIFSKKELEQPDKPLSFYYNSEIRDAVKLAKVSVTQDELIGIQYCFQQNGFCSVTRQGTVKILFIDLDGEPVISVDHYDNPILYYDEYVGVNNIIRCCECGTPIKKTNNKKKYCDGCAEKNRREQDKLRMENLRNSRK